MTSNTQSEPEEKRDTLVNGPSAGLWWRPNCSGYTNSVLHAGLYSEAEAALCCARRGVSGSERAVKLADALIYEDAKSGTVLAHIAEQLDSIPSQISEAVKAEREACMKLALPQYDLLSPEINAERGRVAAAIRARRES